MGLLVLAYAGSLLAGSRVARGGLPASTEQVILGFVIGPSALGFVDKALLATFEPVAQAALGWLAFVLGLHYGVNGGRRVRFARMAGTWGAFLVTGSAVAVAVYGVLAIASPLDVRDRLLVAGGAGAACAETTRYAVRWVSERWKAKGPVTDLAGDFAESDDLAPLLATAAIFALRPLPGLGATQPAALWMGVTVGLGVVLGLIAALLIGKKFQIGEAWGVLLGMSMFTIGAASKLGLSSVAAMFVLGAVLSALSPHRAEITAMVEPTERPVMLPALLLAGASVSFAGARWLVWVVAAALVARLFSKWIVGLLILVGSKATRPAGVALGLGLSSAGALSMSIGLAFALRFPGPVGSAVLACAAASALAGELIGPRALRASLTRAGEIGGAP